MKKGTADWMEFAKRDLEAARLLIHSEYVANIVLFHSQQCIEKCLKALLEENEVSVPKIHSAVKLHTLMTDHTNHELSVSEDDLDLVDLIYIDSRYPSGLGVLPSGFPTREDARDLLKIAEAVYKEISLKLTDKSTG
jgi:HEPN domain-containing protein